MTDAPIDLPATIAKLRLLWELSEEATNPWYELSWLKDLGFAKEDAAYLAFCDPHYISSLAAARVAALEAENKRERPVSNEGRQMNRRKGRMVQASELLAEIKGIMDKFGDTCFYVTGLSWGSVALWDRADIEEGERP